MLPAIARNSEGSHETVEAFRAIGLPLNAILEGMLNEDVEHQRPRRGCGFTQASRFISDLINQPRKLSPDFDLRLFSNSGKCQLKKMVVIGQSLLGRSPEGISDLRVTLEQNLDSHPHYKDYIDQLYQLETLPESLNLEESRLITSLILSILGKNQNNTLAPTVPLYDEKIPVGTCPEAERYFLEFSGGYLRRHGIINIFTDEFEQPLLVEKVNIGDSHSCINIKDLWLNGVFIPAGSLLGTRYTSLPIDTRRCHEFQGGWMPVTVCEGFRFLRLTTLSVAPENRARAFSNHLNIQLAGSPFFDPLNTTLSDLIHVAQQQIPQ